MEPSTNRGRPSRLPEVRDVLLEALRIGMYATDACAYAGISLDSYQRWMERGEAGEPEYEAFYLDAKRAEAEAQKTAIEALRGHFSTAAIAPRDFLARRYPDRWAPHETRTVHQTGEIAVEYTHLLANLDLDAVRGLLQPMGDVLTVEAVEVASGDHAR